MWDSVEPWQRDAIVVAVFLGAYFAPGSIFRSAARKVGTAVRAIIENRRP